MSWNISVTTVIGGGGNRPGIYAGKFSPADFHTLPFLVKLPVGSLFLKTGEQNPDCTVGCAAGIYQKICGDCGESSWALVDSTVIPQKQLVFKTIKGDQVDITLTKTGAIPLWASGDGAEYDTANFSHVYAAGEFTGNARFDDPLTATALVSQVAGLTYIDMNSLPGLLTIDLQANNLLSLDITGLVNLTLLNFGGGYVDGVVVDYTQNTQLTVLNNSRMLVPFMDVTNCTLLEELFVYENALTELDLTGLAVLDILYAGTNLLTTLDVSPCVLLSDLECDNNGFSEAVVDQVIADVVAHSVDNGRMEIHGSNAAPSAAGLADVATLQGRGWTVTVTP